MCGIYFFNIGIWISVIFWTSLLTYTDEAYLSFWHFSQRWIVFISILSSRLQAECICLVSRAFWREINDVRQRASQYAHILNREARESLSRRVLWSWVGGAVHTQTDVQWKTRWGLSLRILSNVCNIMFYEALKNM